MIAHSWMRSRRHRFGGPLWLALVLMAAVLLVPYTGSAAMAVTGPRDLGTLPGTYGSQAYAINDAGQVVGASVLSNMSHGFSWTQVGGIVDLGDLGGTYSLPVDVNASGEVVGQSRTAGDATHAFLWTQAGGMIDLGTLLGGTGTSNAAAVNDNGQVVGVEPLAGETASHAFSWTQAGGVIDLGTLGGAFSEAVAVNQSGIVVGDSYLAGDAASHAFSWTQAGGMIDLGTLGGTNSFPADVNASGQVVGLSQVTGDTAYHAFSWTQASGMIDLTLGGTYGGDARAVNDLGQVIGESWLPGNTARHAFSWTQAGGMIDLGSLGGSSSASAVNGSGLVVGFSSFAGDTTGHAFAWTTAGGMTDLGTLGGTNSEAHGVNASGQVVGLADTQNGPYHAAMWQVASSTPGSADKVVTGGDVVNTDPGGSGPTPTVPVQTRIVVPTGVSGEVKVTPQDPTAPPAGFAFFGQQVVIDAPPATGPAAPYVATFTIDSSALGAIAPADVQVFRNGVPVDDCTDPVQAIPDPCVAARGLVAGGGGDAFVTVRTTHFSTWSVGRLAYTPSGFFAPVDNLPTVNTVKAGSAVPVKFGLGGNRGLNVFAAGSPSLGSATSCAGTVDPVEQTVTAGASSLSYDSGTGRYQYVWKTDKTWTGCRDLTLRFRDGSTLRARFSFK